MFTIRLKTSGVLGLIQCLLLVFIGALVRPRQQPLADCRHCLGQGLEDQSIAPSGKKVAELCFLKATNLYLSSESFGNI